MEVGSCFLIHDSSRSLVFVAVEEGTCFYFLVKYQGGFLIFEVGARFFERESTHTN